MKSKMIAIVAVLALVLTPFFAITETETDGEPIPEINLSTLLDGPDKDNYWVKANIDPKDSSNVLLTNQDGNSNANLTLDFDEPREDIRTVTMVEQFEIMKDNGLTLGQYGAIFFSITVSGTLSQAPSSDAILESSGENGILDVKNRGSINDVRIKSSTQKSDESFCRLVNGLNKKIETRVNMDGVLSMNKEYECAFIFDGSLTVLDIDDFTLPTIIGFKNNLRLSYKCEKEVVSVAHCNPITPNNFLWSVEFSGSTNSCFMIDTNPTSNGRDTITLSGNLQDGFLSYKKGEGNNPVFRFINLTLFMTPVDLCQLPEVDVIYFGNDDGLVNYSSDLFRLSGDPIKNKTICSATDEPVTVLLLFNIGGAGKTITFESTVNNEGKTGHALYTVASEGAHVDKSNVFVESGKNIDLTTIGVTCGDGYEFVGWFYVDEKGTLRLIENPTDFAVTENMIIYAIAQPNGDVPIPTPSEGDSSFEMSVGIVGLIIVTIVGIGFIAIVCNRY